jgi:hypothetical protein
MEAATMNRPRKPPAKIDTKTARARLPAADKARVVDIAGKESPRAGKLPKRERILAPMQRLAAASMGGVSAFADDAVTDPLFSLAFLSGGSAFAEMRRRQGRQGNRQETPHA